MTTRTRLVLVGLAVAVIAIAIVITASSSSTSKKQSTQSSTPVTGTTGTTTTKKPETPPPPPVVLVRNGNPVGGIKKLKFDKGERARFVVDSDVADEVHVHGYDIMRDVTAGHRVAFDFAATKDGIFEIELEDHKLEIASLQVQP